MAQQGINYAAEFERLQELELGEPLEPYTRLIAISIAGVLIFIYTGWGFALAWPTYFLIAFGAHYVFVGTRKSFASRTEVIISALLFLNVQVAYSWLPTYMVSSDNNAIMLIGHILIAAQLLFLVRRSDTLRIYNVVQVLVVAAMGIAIYISFIPHFDSPLAFFGAAFALIALNFYFMQSLRISRRIRLSRESASRQAHQAQKMAAIGQLAGGVAHDFNNNLTAIIGSLELAQLSSNPQDHQSDLDNALTAARQAATTVKQLMIFARMEKPDISAIKLQDVLTELNSLTRRLIPVSVTFQMQNADPQEIVRADRGQLLAGLINLIVNAVDAMPQGGSLTLQANRIKISQYEPMIDGSLLTQGNYIKIIVTDTGHGIPPGIISNVIDPFFTTKPVGKGTGLGLSMVAGMLQEFGGGLTISSDADGTQITLFLPLIEQRVPTQ